MSTSDVAKKDRGRERTSEKSGWELLPKHRIRNILTPQESDPMQHLPTGFQDCYRRVCCAPNFPLIEWQFVF